MRERERGGKGGAEVGKMEGEREEKGVGGEEYYLLSLVVPCRHLLILFITCRHPLLSAVTRCLPSAPLSSIVN